MLFFSFFLNKINNKSIEKGQSTFIIDPSFGKMH